MGFDASSRQIEQNRLQRRSVATSLFSGQEQASAFDQIDRQSLRDQRDLRVQQNRGGFGQGFSDVISQQVEQVGTLEEQFTRLGSTVAGIFGPDGTFTRGIADALTESIVLGESLASTFAAVGQAIVTEILSAIIQMGVQFAANQAMQLLGIKTTTTAQLASVATTTQATVAGMTAITAAAAPAAAAVSTATVGAAPAAAATSLGTFLPIMLALLGGAAIGALAFKDGGHVRGPGGPRGDKIPAFLSDNEYVVNAAAVSRGNNLAILEAMNNGQVSFGGGTTTNSYQNDVQINVQTQPGQNPEEFARAVQPIVRRELNEQLRIGGQLENSRGRGRIR